MDAQNVKPQSAQETEMLTLNLEGSSEKKAAKKWPVITAIIIGALAVVAISAGFIVKHLQKPAEDQSITIADIEREAFGQDILTDFNFEDPVGQSAEIQFDINGFALSMLTTQFPELEALEVLNGMSADIAVEHNSGMERFVLGLESDATLLGPFEVIIDSNTQCAYVSSDSFGNRYLKHDFSADQEQETDMQMTQIILDALCDSDKTNRYFNSFLELMTAQKSETATMTANGVSQECTVYSAEIDLEALVQLLIEYLEELKQDSPDHVDNIDSFIGEIQDALEGEDDLGCLYWNVITNDDGDIIGRKIGDENERGMYYLYTIDGTELGFELSVSSLEIIGNAELDDGYLDGIFIVSMDGADYMKISTSEFNIQSFMNGKPNGSFELEPTDDFMHDVLGMELGLPLSLTAEFESKENETHIVLSIMELATISMQLKQYELDTITLPEGEEISTEDPDALLGLLDGIDPDLNL